MSIIYVPSFRRFSPILRLAQDLDSVSRSQCSPARRQNHYRSVLNFTPRFDVRETDSAYELYGELPGLTKENVNIEWSDRDTLVVSGRQEARTEKTNPKTEAATTDTAASNAAEAAVIEVEKSAEAHTGSDSYHAPTVEDDENEYEQVSNPDSTTPTGTAGAEKTAEQPTAEVSPQSAASAPAKTDYSARKARYWLTERSVGSFTRRFTFAQHVEYDAVTASLKDGVLNIVVPKASKVEQKKIEIA